MPALRVSPALAVVSGAQSLWGQRKTGGKMVDNNRCSEQVQPLTYRTITVLLDPHQGNAVYLLLLSVAKLHFLYLYGFK
jgi:hypothetical protein